jgi:hypothetical protein
MARLGPVAGFGMAPAPVSAGAGVAVGLADARTSMEVAATTFLPSSHDAQLGFGGTLWPLAVAAVACEQAWTTSSLHVGGCIGMDYERLQGSSYGVNRPGSGSADWIAPLLAPFVRYDLTPVLSIALRPDVTFPLRAPTFSLGGVGRIYAVSAVEMRTWLGVELRL